MTLVWLAFLVIAGVLWGSTYGYLLLLWLRAGKEEESVVEGETLPEILVVVPVLNEAERIVAKLRDLETTDYPADRMSVVVLDGGSTDGTAEVARDVVNGMGRVSFMEVGLASPKAERVNHALAAFPAEFLVFTDVDSSLEPSCIRELIIQLSRDRRTAAVGATVSPVTELVEERLHWWLLNRLWWLEGEAFSTAGLSGVCYACRRSLVAQLAKGVMAEDVHLALTSAARGYRVRICREARAWEERVPRTASEFVSFRRRRGRVYLQELQRDQNGAAPSGWHLVRLVRRWHFLVTPKLALLFALTGILLAVLRSGLLPAVVLAMLVIPGLAVLLLGPSQSGIGRGRLWAVGRYLVLLGAAMLPFGLVNLERSRS